MIFERRKDQTNQNLPERPLPKNTLVQVILLLLERRWLTPERVPEILYRARELQQGRHRQEVTSRSVSQDERRKGCEKVPLRGTGRRGVTACRMLL